MDCKNISKKSLKSNTAALWQINPCHPRNPWLKISCLPCEMSLGLSHRGRFFSEPAPEFTPAKAGEGRGG